MKRLKVIGIIFFAIFGLTTLLFAQAANENLTVTTYYPSPSGTYNNLSTNRLITDVSAATPVNFGVMSPGDALINNRLRVSTTNFSPNTADLAVGGNVAIGSGYVDDNPPTNGLIVEGNVGLGTNNPRTALDVNGAIRLGRQNTCNPTFAGTMRYNSSVSPGRMEFCDGNSWITMGGLGETLVVHGTMSHMGSNCTGSASCPSGYKLTGGGINAATVMLSAPNSAGTAWQCLGFDTSSPMGPSACSCYAVCAR